MVPVVTQLVRPTAAELADVAGVFDQYRRHYGQPVIAGQALAWLTQHTSSGVLATFEEWDSGGRVFDSVVAAHAWHWIDPVLAAAKTARVLRAGGLVAVFWNAADVPGDLRQAFAEVYRRVLPGSTAAELYARPGPAADAFGAFLDQAAEGLAQTGAFGPPERWRYDWQHDYARDEWLDQVATHGGANLIPPGQLDELADGLAHAIDAAGGGFTMSYATVAVAAARR